jgi:hypothetical protein
VARPEAIVIGDREQRATLEATQAEVRELGKALELEHDPHFAEQVAQLTGQVEAARRELGKATASARTVHAQLEGLTRVVEGLIARLEQAEHARLHPVFATLALVLGVLGGAWALPPFEGPPTSFAKFGVVVGVTLGLLAGPRLLAAIGVPNANTAAADAIAKLAVALGVAANAVSLFALAEYFEHEQARLQPTVLGLVGVGLSLAVFLLVEWAGRSEATVNEATRSLARRVAALPLAGGLAIALAQLEFLPPVFLVPKVAAVAAVAALALTFRQGLASLGRFGWRWVKERKRRS